MPEADYAINLCDNRYLFLVSMCAVAVRKQTNLFPSNKNPATQSRLAERYQSAYILHHGQAELSSNLSDFDISHVEWQAVSQGYQVPELSLEHVAVISFTSGSTGDAKPNLKTWRTLRDSTAINAAYMLPNNVDVFHHLATVPGQHMWGLETSVLMALFANVCLVDAHPLYPMDIVDLLERLPNPKSLISTPLHLRSLDAIDHKLPKLANVLVATAPLNQELAQRIEQKFDTQLREVYGCSEVGSMAVRRTAKTDIWTQFSGLIFDANEAGEVTVCTDYLPEKITLEDQLEMLEPGKFRLTGRVSDQVNIAGKRGSLLEVNNVLMKFAGLIDGVVFFPAQDRAVPRLVAMVVLKENASKGALRDHFKETLDAAFVPRPILLVGALPREDNGKLIKAKLLDLYHSLIKN